MRVPYQLVPSVSQQPDESLLFFFSSFLSPAFVLLFLFLLLSNCIPYIWAFRARNLLIWFLLSFLFLFRYCCCSAFCD